MEPERPYLRLWLNGVEFYADGFETDREAEMAARAVGKEVVRYDDVDVVTGGGE